jgi:hypothetical protein
MQLEHDLDWTSKPMFISPLPTVPAIALNYLSGDHSLGSTTKVDVFLLFSAPDEFQ